MADSDLTVAVRCPACGHTNSAQPETAHFPCALCGARSAFCSCEHCEEIFLLRTELGNRSRVKCPGCNAMFRPNGLNLATAAAFRDLAAVRADPRRQSEFPELQRRTVIGGAGLRADNGTVCNLAFGDDADSRAHPRSPSTTTGPFTSSFVRAVRSRGSRRGRPRHAAAGDR
jgi:hypothetical protein